MGMSNCKLLRAIYQPSSEVTNVNNPDNPGALRATRPKLDRRRHEQGRLRTWVIMHHASPCRPCTVHVHWLAYRAYGDVPTLPSFLESYISFVKVIVITWSRTKSAIFRFSAVPPATWASSWRLRRASAE